MHIPVLQKEVLEYLDPKPNENFIDCTINGGGHALAILEKIKPNGKILGIDLDEKVTGHLKIKDNLILVCDNYVNLKEIVEKNQTARFARCNSSGIKNFRLLSGILFDLGMSSWHLEESGRGFSFMRDEPLDMRYSIKSQITAERIINEFSKEEIERILREYGEERFAKRIAREIVEARKIKPIRNTFQLVEVIKKAFPSRYKYSKLHFATRTFQALRIAVNDELNNLKKALPQAIGALENRGRIVVISFHSLEDRIVKNFFKEEVKKGLIKILTKKPVRPTEEEIKINPRCRSAKLRAAIKQ